MKKIGRDEYLAMRDGARVLEADSFGDKVLLLADGNILKLFRRKRLLTSAAWYPYAQRFADNAEALRRRDVPVPAVLAVFRIPAIKRDAVLYRPLAGKTLREMCRAGLPVDTERELKAAFTMFVRYLHDRGVYFRSLHLGNVVHTPEGRFGLIDISDARIGSRPLRKSLRARNLRRLQGISDEAAWVDAAAVLDDGEAPRSGR